MIFSGRSGGGMDASLGYYASSGQFVVNVCDSNNWYHDGYATTSLLSTNTWHMITTTADSSKWVIYVDSAQLVSGTYSASTTGVRLVSSGETLQIGSNYSWDPSYFKGSIDDFNIYNSAFTATQIASLYANSTILRIDGLPIATPVQIASGATLDLNGQNQQINSLADGAGGGGAVVSSTTGSMTLTLAPTGTTTFSGRIQDGAGTVSVTLNGAGTQILAGSNTYSGGTTISSGTLQLGDGASTNGSVAGNITDNARLVFANPNAQTYSGAISGSGSITKTGAGALVLAASNIYSGGTEVDAGTLVVSNGSNGSATGSGAVTLSGGTLASGASGGSISGGVQIASVASEIAPGGIGSIGPLTIGSLLAASNLTTLNFDLTTPDGSGDLLVITGGLTLAPHTAITFGTNPTKHGHYRLIGGSFGTPNLSDFDLPTAPADEQYSLSTTADPGYIDLVVVPEPSTLVLLGVAAIGLLGYARRRKRMG